MGAELEKKAPEQKADPNQHLFLYLQSLEQEGFTGPLAPRLREDLLVAANLAGEHMTSMIRGLSIAEAAPLQEISPEGVYLFQAESGLLTYDPSRRLAISPLLPGKEIHLSPRQGNILEALLRDPKVWSPEELHKKLYGTAPPSKEARDSIKKIISTLRKKLGDSQEIDRGQKTGNWKLIINISHRGYTLNNRPLLATMDGGKQESPEIVERKTLFHKGTDGFITMDLERYTVVSSLNVAPVQLTRTEGIILILLMGNPRHTFSLNMLVEAVKTEIRNSKIDEETVRKYIHSLRRKMDQRKIDHRNPGKRQFMFINNIRDLGYSLTENEF